MTTRSETLASRVTARFGERLTVLPALPGDVAFEVPAENLLEVCCALRDEHELGFEQLIDLTVVDYLHYGRDEWATESTTATGFSRGVECTRDWRGDVSLERGAPNGEQNRPGRFAAVYHLLSVSNNWRLRLRSYASAGEPPTIDSVVEVWSAADWYEREAFDLFGVLFKGHPDLRRILTDYGFIGHPFRKDFPLTGNVEVKYDPAKGRVVYQPVTIEPRTLVPRVIREDNRYDVALKDVPVGTPSNGAAHGER